MRAGDLALTPIPQADGIVKNRPVVLLREMPPYRDFLVCGVSTQLQQRVNDFDEVIAPTDVDFKASGLQKESLIRLGFLTVLPRNAIFGSIGAIAQERHRKLLMALNKYLANF
jgi:mRNA interferase MazF